ncbi:alpha/beta fold hydrolase [Microbulbifer sp. SA54]|uniref:alpha/beta fold hydrolase n=1 Tax=Microbulbifer sp. SA54 TaxID=3401577 RepID=UPI003AAD37B9
MNNLSVPREISLDLSGNRIAARQWGNPQGIPVLALHGWLDNCASFDRLAPLLPELNLVAVDLAGHGQSYHRHAEANYNIWGEIEDVIEMADALGWERFSMLSHSRGAVISMIAAATFPERVKRLALIDGLVPPPAADSEAPEILRNGIEQRARYRNRQAKVFASLEIAVAARKNGLFKLSDDAAQRLVERGVRSCEGGYTWSNDPQLLASSLAKLNSAQVEAFLARATMPIRLALGKSGIQDMITRVRPVAEKCANIEIREFPGGHHLHMEESADAIAEWFRPFLISGEE